MDSNRSLFILNSPFRSGPSCTAAQPHTEQCDVWIIRKHITDGRPVSLCTLFPFAVYIFLHINFYCMHRTVFTVLLCCLSGYSLLPAGKADNLSDSSHSEISSRSSICSVDSMPAPGPEDRYNSSNRTCSISAANATIAATTAPAAVVESTAALHAHFNADYNQPSTR